MLGSEMGQRSAMPMGTYIRRAAKELGFNEAAVGKRLKKGYGTQKLSRFRSVFSNQEEVEIVSLSKELNKTFYGILFKSLRFLLFHYAESNKIPSPSNKDKMAAGKDFAIAVMRRHKLTLCIPTKIS
ncbi:hypothetical protein QE152_g29296 [Popillia japonica]|uniref:Uncharacterized protein n=1 Tax=Popillia japonica TaxID=7064 RepID=A0AAW1JIK5_POPJA